MNFFYQVVNLYRPKNTPLQDIFLGDVTTTFIFTMSSNYDIDSIVNTNYNQKNSKMLSYSVIQSMTS